MEFLDKLGWPVERVKGRPILNFLRLCIHTRRIVRRWEPTRQESNPDVDAYPPPKPQCPPNIMVKEGHLPTGEQGDE